MSKIVCDVCGTSYTDSATQCPICGCVRPVDSIAINNDPQEMEESRPDGYTYVKGGRFSKSNVRKRNTGVPVENQKKKRTNNSNSEQKESSGDKGLIIAVCMLLLAIIAVVVYIVIHFFGPQSTQSAKPGESSSVQPSMVATSATETDDTQSMTPCTAIALSQTKVSLEIGQTHQLTVTVEPNDTTDAVVFTSANATVATVNGDGLIQAVSEGETAITATCGAMTIECKVVCTAPAVTSEPAEVTEATEPVTPTETTQSTSEFVGPFRLNRHIAGKPTEREGSTYVGSSFSLKLLDSNNKVVPVVWEVENNDVCSVKNNIVTGIKKGTTKIFTTYEGVTYTCLVQVK